MLDLGSALGTTTAKLFGNKAVVDQIGELTVCFWIKMRTLATAGNPQNAIVSKRPPAQTSGWTIDEFWDGSIGGRLVVESDSRQVGTSNKNLTVGQMTHVAVVYDNEGVVSFYFDGVFDTSIRASAFAVTTATSAELRVGASEARTSVAAYMGPVRIFNYALKPHEVAMEYKHAMGAPDGGLVFWVSGEDKMDFGDFVSGDRVSNESGSVVDVKDPTDEYYIEETDIDLNFVTARDDAARRLNFSGAMTDTFKFHCGLAGQVVELGADVLVSHASAPSHDGQGWGYKKWQRRHMKLLGADLRSDARVIDLTLLDMERSLLWLYDTLQNPFATKNQGGSARFAWADLVCDRDSLAFIEDDQGRTTRYMRRMPRITTKGLLVEGPASNLLQQSTFRLSTNPPVGVSQWTKVGHGVNGSDVIQDPDDFNMTEPRIAGTIAQGLRHTAGSPLGGTDLEVKQTVTSPQNVAHQVHLEYRDEVANDTYDLVIQRSSDSRYLDSSGNWQVALQYIQVTTSLNYTWFSSPVFTPNGSENITVGIRARRTAGQKNHVVQCEMKTESNRSSPVCNRNTYLVTRAIDNCFYPNNRDRRVFPVQQGTLGFLYRPAVTPPASTDRVLLYLFQDAANLNYLKLFIRASDNALVGEIKVGGITYTAVKSGITWTLDVEKEIAFRWTGANGELGLANYTYDVFADGVKGIAAVGAGVMTEDLRSKLYIGSNKGATEAAWGYFRVLKVTPIVLPDAVIQGWLK